jgi:hypothetical protein
MRLSPRRARAALARRRRRSARTPADAGFDFRAAACPDGKVTEAPDFVGVGAPESGTSWWFSLLQRHPDVTDAFGHRELGFLNTFIAADPSAADAATYASWFPRPPGAIAGEWTPDYLVRSWLGPALRQLAPAAKVMMMVRDPVERYSAGISRALSPEGNVPHAAEASQLFVGLYAAHLARLERFLDDDALLVLQYERCVLEPQAELARTFRFLGVEPIAIPDVPAAAVDGIEAPGTPRFELSAERRAVVVAAYRPDVERLVARHPEIDLALWKNFG